MPKTETIRLSDSVLRTAYWLSRRGMGRRSGSGILPLWPRFRRWGAVRTARGSVLRTANGLCPRGIGVVRTARGSAGASPYLCDGYSKGYRGESKGHCRASLPASRSGSYHLRSPLRLNTFSSLFSASSATASLAPSTPRCPSNEKGDDPRNHLGLAGARPSVGRLGSLADVALLQSVTFEPKDGKKSGCLEAGNFCATT